MSPLSCRHTARAVRVTTASRVTRHPGGHDLPQYALTKSSHALNASFRQSVRIFCRCECHDMTLKWFRSSKCINALTSSRLLVTRVSRSCLASSLTVRRSLEVVVPGRGGASLVPTLAIGIITTRVSWSCLALSVTVRRSLDVRTWARHRNESAPVARSDTATHSRSLDTQSRRLDYGKLKSVYVRSMAQAGHKLTCTKFCICNVEQS